MITIGSVVLKIAGRDAGRLGVVLDVKDGRVLIDGEVRRREVSIAHIEPVGQTVDIAKGASTESVREALKGLGVEFPEPFANKRPRIGGPKPVKQRASDRKAVKPTKKKAPAKKTAEAKDAAKAKKATPKKSAPKKAPAKKKAPSADKKPSADETSK